MRWRWQSHYWNMLNIAGWAALWWVMNDEFNVVMLMRDEIAYGGAVWMGIAAAAIVGELRAICRKKADASNRVAADGTATSL